MCRNDMIRIGESEEPLGWSEGALTPQQAHAAFLLATGTRQRDAAAQLEVREETISRWCRIPAFRAAVEEYHRQLAAAAMAMRLSLATKAVQRLDDLLSHSNPSVALRAAQILLDGLKMRDVQLLPDQREEAHDDAADFRAFVRAVTADFESVRDKRRGAESQS